MQSSKVIMNTIKYCISKKEQISELIANAYTIMTDQHQMSDIYFTFFIFDIQTLQPLNSEPKGRKLLIHNYSHSIRYCIYLSSPGRTSRY